jgi:hypothetical protein
MAVPLIKKIVKIKDNSMKTIVALQLVASLFLLLCSSAEEKERLLWKTTGWIDDNTYRIYVEVNSPVKKFNDDEKMKEYSRRSAMIIAQSELLGIFTKKNKMLPVDDDAGPYLRNGDEIIFAIKNGRIIAERFSSSMSCALIYEVRLDQMKHKSNNAIFDLNRHIKSE